MSAGATPNAISDPKSLVALFDRVDALDGIVYTGGAAQFKPWDQTTDEDCAFCLANKLMGQVNVVRLGASKVRARGAITLTTAVLAQHPMPGGAMVTTVNAAVEAFVRAAAVEPLNVRVNAVSPGWVTELFRRWDATRHSEFRPLMLHRTSCASCAKDRQVRLRSLLAAENTARDNERPAADRILTLLFQKPTEPVRRPLPETRATGEVGAATVVGSIRGLKWCFPDVETSPRKQLTGEIALRHGVANERLGVACDRRLGAGGGCDCPSARVGGSGLVARLWLQPCQITTHGERRGSGDDAPLCVDPRSSRTAILVRAPEEFVGNRVSCSHTPAKARHHHPPAERRSAFGDKRRS